MIALGEKSVAHVNTKGWAFRSGACLYLKTIPYNADTSGSEEMMWSLEFGPNTLVEGKWMVQVKETGHELITAEVGEHGRPRR